MSSKSHPSDWGSDTPPSAPVAPSRPRYVHMGGFCFTDGGIAPDVNEEDAAAFRSPPIGPSTIGTRP